MIFMLYILNLYGKFKSELSDKGLIGFKMFFLKFGQVIFRNEIECGFYFV